MNEPGSPPTPPEGTPLNGAAPEGNAAPDATAGHADTAVPQADPDSSPARELSLHLLRMLETRIDAAGIALQGETQLLMARLQLKLLAAAAIFIAIWGGIVLLAIALPPPLRVPVLSAVVIGFVLLAVGAQLYSRRKASNQAMGSLHWFLDSLRQDFEVLSRTLSRPAPDTREPGHRSAPRDLAA